MTKQKHLSRRERQIMDILFERPESSARDVHDSLPDAPSYSTVRALLSILVDKGHIRFQTAGAKYLYSPVEDVGKAQTNAVKRLTRTFFGGSTANVVSALLGKHSANISDEELDELAHLIEKEKAKRH
ncbi:MAG: BlaI/MecI/CopY family transcriptional regulator [Pseudomonadota bacterium]